MWINTAKGLLSAMTLGVWCKLLLHFHRPIIIYHYLIKHCTPIISLHSLLLNWTINLNGHIIKSEFASFILNIGNGIELLWGNCTTTIGVCVLLFYCTHHHHSLPEGTLSSVGNYSCFWRTKRYYFGNALFVILYTFSMHTQVWLGKWNVFFVIQNLIPNRSAMPEWGMDTWHTVSQEKGNSNIYLINEKCLRIWVMIVKQRVHFQKVTLTGLVLTGPWRDNVVRLVGSKYSTVTYSTVCTKLTNQYNFIWG